MSTGLRDMNSRQLAAIRRREIEALRRLIGQDRTGPGARETIQKRIRAAKRELMILVG